MIEADSQVAFAVGDEVWTTRREWPLSPYAAADMVQAKVERAPNHPYGFYTLRLSNGAVARRRVGELRVYDAINALADLSRCAACRDFGQRECPEHRDLIFAATAATSGVVTIECPVLACNYDFGWWQTEESDAESDADQPRPRRKLTPRERERRRAKQRAARRSRKRNSKKR